MGMTAVSHDVVGCVVLKVSLCCNGHGLLSLSTCSLSLGGGLAGKAKSGLESSRSRKGHISEMLGPQDDALRGMDTWQPPEPLSRPPSALERERRVRIF